MPWIEHNATHQKDWPLKSAKFGRALFSSLLVSGEVKSAV